MLHFQDLRNRSIRLTDERLHHLETDHPEMAGQTPRDYDRAIADYDKAIALNPNYTDAYYNRAIAWFFKKDYNKAWADVEQCRRAGGTPNPQFVEALRKASGKQEYGEQLKEAVVAYRRVIEIAVAHDAPCLQGAWEKEESYEVPAFATANDGFAVDSVALVRVRRTNSYPCA